VSEREEGVGDDGGERGLEPDAEKAQFLREIGREIRESDDTSEAKQVAAIVYRISDIYDENEDTDARDVYVNMRQILDVKERGDK
jgi:hypothetical protein